MVRPTSSSRRRIACVALLPVAALALGACKPKPAAAPPPPTVSCTWGPSLSGAIEWCHLTYASFNLDGTNTSAQALADNLAATMPSCSNLGSRHTPGATLLAQYPGSLGVGENLYCLGQGAGNCPSPTFGATKAMNAWLASPGHSANIHGFIGKWVNAAAACNPATGLYFGVAQFHKP